VLPSRPSDRWLGYGLLTLGGLLALNTVLGPLLSDVITSAASGGARLQRSH
jgi:hypothetical protein